MKYHVISLDKKYYEFIKEYDTEEQAEKKLAKLQKKNDKKNYKIVKVPEVRAGLKLFRDDIYKLTIVKEAKWTWYLNNTENPMFYDDCMLKDHIYKYFYLGVYDEGIESYNSEYEGNIYDPVEEIKVDFTDEEDNNNDTNSESEEMDI